jgi:benzoyl-CoA reductase/2-hydroxyglutaryl-CoA dehydratase subunit BcrC/BadD/HgdB
LPAFREADDEEETVVLPDGQIAPAVLVRYVQAELERLCEALRRATGAAMDETALVASIQHANRVRALVREIRQAVFSAASAPLPALELLLVEILALHYCSDRDRCLDVLRSIRDTVVARTHRNDGCTAADAVRICWVNPVADLRVLNWLEEVGGRLCGSDFMTAQSMVAIPEEVPPLTGLARAVLCDHMIGSNRRRAHLIAAEAQRWSAEAVVVARIPGASHCWGETESLTRTWPTGHGIPVIEIEVPPVADADAGQIRGRLEALVETVREQRRTLP